MQHVAPAPTSPENAALALARLDAAIAADAAAPVLDRYGRRPDLDAHCSECAADGIATTRYGHGTALAMMAAPSGKRDREWPYRRYKAALVFHCPYHGQVEPLG